MIKNIQPFILTILIIIFGFCVYYNSLRGGFVWDDDLLIKENIYIKRWANIPKIFTRDWGAGAGIKYNFYRPLTIFTYLVNYSLGKFDVKIYHLTNVMLHLLAALCLYWFITLLYDARLLSFLTSAFFVAHPIHTEAVSYISGRADSLVLLFMLLSFIFYIVYIKIERLSFYSLALLSYVLSLLSKENALILPLLLLLYHYGFKKKIRVPQFMSVLFISFFYILARLTILKSAPFGALALGKVFQKIPGFFVAIIGYIRLLLLPINLHMEYGNKLFKISNPVALFGFFTSLLLLVYAVRKRNKNNLVFFSIMWFFISLLPVSNLYPLAFYMAEHYLYIPSIGFFLILAKGLVSLYERKDFRLFAVGTAVFLITFYSYATIKQNDSWKDPVTFYKRTLRFYPESTRACYNLALVYSKIEKQEESIALYKKVLILDPNFILAYNNLALLYNAKGESEKAIALLKRAIEIKPDFVEGYNSLALVYRSLDKNDDAIRFFRKAIEIDPNYEASYNNLGNTLESLGSIKEATELYMKALEINPDSQEIHCNLGNAYGLLGKHDEAIASYKNAIRIDPDYSQAYNNLGAEYVTLGKKEEAISSFEKAVELDPRNGEAHNNLAVVYYYSNQRDLAIKHCDEALRLGYEVPPDFLKLLEPKRTEKK